MALGARVARGFAYVLLVVTCTVVAALGGYTIGTRSSPSERVTAAQQAAEVRDAVARAVARQKAEDRVLRRDALQRLAAFQREKFDGELSRRVSEVRQAEAANAARAYRRGRTAGRATAIRAAREREAEESAADPAEAAVAAADAADAADGPDDADAADRTE